LATSLGKPLIAVNHLEGHVHAVLLEAYRAGLQPKLPAVCLIVSGGHTVLYERAQPRVGKRADNAKSGSGKWFRLPPRIGQTRDDAAGEAYDKVAKLLALGLSRRSQSLTGSSLRAIEAGSGTDRGGADALRNPLWAGDQTQRQSLRFQFQRHQDGRALLRPSTS
jgi:hypothetical protein